MTDYLLAGAAAPPMLNGELVFEAPWQGRAFGIARGMAEHGVYAWDDFRDRLIAEIGAFDRDAAAVARSDGTAPEFRYYDHFLRALERLLVERRIVADGDLQARVRAFEERPRGHDHAHDHHHDHSHNLDHADARHRASSDQADHH